MKLLITGGTGLIGQAIISQAQTSSYAVHYLTTSKKKIITQQNYKGFYWDPAKGIIDPECLTGVAVIIHLAGASISKRWTKKYQKELLSSRIKSTRLLYDTLKKNSQHRVKSILCASAIGLYPSAENIFYTENFKTKPVSFIEKLINQWEDESKKLQSLVSVGCTMRIGLVLAPAGGILDVFLKSMHYKLAIGFGTGKQWQSWIHLDDLVALFFKAIADKWGGTFNAVAPNPVRQKTLLKTINIHFKKHALLIFIPSFLVKIILGEQHSLVLGSQKVTAQKVIDKGFSFAYPHLDEAIKSCQKK